MCNFTMATDETYKDRAGERQKRTEWHRIVVWAKLAEICQQYLRKGSLVYIEGRIATREWEKDGQKRTSTEIVASNMRMLGSRSDSAAAGASAGGGSMDAEAHAPAAEDTPASDISDEDIPF